MGIFDGLANDSSDESDTVNHSEGGLAEQSNGVAAINLGNGYIEEENTGDWKLTRSVRRRETSLGAEEDACFICSRGLSRRNQVQTIPCSSRCNTETLVHKKCLSKWRENKSSCPLCRSALSQDSQTALTAAPSFSALKDTDDDDGLSNSFVEMDVKARRSHASRRSGKTNTHKAAQQRKYAMGKRDAQRAAMKGSREDYSKNSEEDE